MKGHGYTRSDALGLYEEALTAIASGHSVIGIGPHGCCDVVSWDDCSCIRVDVRHSPFGKVASIPAIGSLFEDAAEMQRWISEALDNILRVTATAEASVDLTLTLSLDDDSRLLGFQASLDHTDHIEAARITGCGFSPQYIVSSGSVSEDSDCDLLASELVSDAIHNLFARVSVERVNGRSALVFDREW